MQEIDRISSGFAGDYALAAEYGKEDLGVRGRETGAKTSAAYEFSRRGGPMDFKKNIKGLNTANCPSVDCLQSVMLCDFCLSDQIPGNIAFGFATEYAGLDVGNAYISRMYSNMLAMGEWFAYQKRQLMGEDEGEDNPGFVDTEEDTAAISGGSSLAKAMKQKGANKDTLKKLLCRLVKENLTSKGGKKAKFKALPCPACET
jgi:hypothetical protein